MKQKFKCPEPGCPHYVYFELNLIVGAFLNRTINTISIRNQKATIQLDERGINQGEKPGLRILEKGQLFLGAGGDDTLTAHLTCIEGHTFPYEVELT